MNKKQVFQKVSSDAIKNIFCYGISTLVIFFIANALLWHIFALILAAILTIAVLIGLIPFLLAFVSGLIMIPLAFAEKRKGNVEAFKGQKWLWGGQVMYDFTKIIHPFLYPIYGNNSIIK